MSKILHIEIVDTCDECPYCEHDPHYSMSYDSGYDCNNSGPIGRIVDDHELHAWAKSKKQADNSLDTLFPRGFTEPNPLSIPADCPLQDR